MKHLLLVLLSMAFGVTSAAAPAPVPRPAKVEPLPPGPARLCIPASQTEVFRRALENDSANADRQKLANLFKAAAEEAPPKGTKEDWSKRNLGLAQQAELIGSEADMGPRKGPRYNLAISCIACHADHKK